MPGIGLWRTRMADFVYGVFRGPSAIGRLVACESGGLLAALRFVKAGGPSAEALEAAEEAGLEGFRPGRSEFLEKCFSELEEYFSGARFAFDLPLALRGSEFDRLAWGALMSIPYGETMSYAGQAARMGRAGAARAAGGANGRNPAAIVVPCHRVIGSDGSLGGFGPGVGKKRWLLEHERRNVGRRPHSGR